MRPVTAADFDTIYDIYMDDSVNPFMTYEPCTKEAFQDVFLELTGRDYFWLFQHNGQDCGMCGIVTGKGRKSHVATIVSLGLKKDFQGLGLGKQIIQKVLRDLKDNGFSRIDLQVESDNSKAISFYKRMGFSVEGQKSKYLKRANDDDYVDEIMMAQIF